MHRLISIEKAAEILDVSVSTVRNYIKRGLLKAYRLGGLLRVWEDEVYALIENSVVHPEKQVTPA